MYKFYMLYLAIQVHIYSSIIVRLCRSAVAAHLSEG